MFKREYIDIINRTMAPGYSTCGRCGWAWKFLKSHETQYSNNRGCFPLCEECWLKLTPEQRLPYYRKLYDAWTDHTDKIWEDIEKAVLEGK